MEQPDDRTWGEKVSDSVAKFGGSWRFIISGLCFVVLWVLANLLSLAMIWDPDPFILLNLFLSLVAAFQAPFILMAQRRVEMKQDAIYRALFREIKELIEVDLSLEHQVLANNDDIRREIEALRAMLEKLTRDGGQ